MYDETMQALLNLRSLKIPVLLISEIYNNNSIYQHEVQEESFRLFNSIKARKERSFQEIHNNCIIGKKAELIIREIFNDNNSRFISYNKINSCDIYHDLFDSYNNQIIEVKSWNKNQILNICEFIKNDSAIFNKNGYNHSNKLIIFSYEHDQLLNEYFYIVYAILDLNNKIVVSDFKNEIITALKWN